MKFTIVTLGCKVNQYESQAMAAMLEERGHFQAEEGEADAIIINTCSVTAESSRKSRQTVRRMKAGNQNAAIAVCGCFSQVSPREAESLGADLVCGSGDRIKLVESVEDLFDERQKESRSGTGQRIFVDDPFKRTLFEELPSGAVGERTRAMLKIEDGCDNFCSYCVIPYARGRVRSLPLSSAKREVERLALSGYREIVITGIEIASYGKDLESGTGLAELVETVSAAAPGVRFRLGSLEPTVVTEDFCRRISKTGNVCNHFHLSLQSGCDSVLRAMRRRYDTARFFESVSLLREYFPGCALTADLITGFPGETEEGHGETICFIEKCGFASMHIFPYSNRPGTRAAGMPGALSRKEKADRAARAQAVADVMQERYLRGCVGTVQQVLFETGEEGRAFGHAGNYMRVSVCGEKLRGLVKNVNITGIIDKMLVGEVI